MAGNFRLFSYENDKMMQLLREDFIMTLTSDMKVMQDLVPVMNDENKIDYAIACETKCFGKVYKNKTVIVFEDR